MTASHHVPFYVWTDESLTTMRTLWIAGKTANQIAAVLGTSRHAVMGKAGRIGLTKEFPHDAHFSTSKKVKAAPGWKLMVKRGAQPGATVGSALAAASRGKPPVGITLAGSGTKTSHAPQRALPAQDPRPARYGAPVSFMALRPSHCRKPMWPHGTIPPVEGQFYCGNRAPETSPYCDACRPKLSYPTPARTGRPLPMAPIGKYMPPSTDRILDPEVA